MCPLMDCTQNCVIQFVCLSEAERKFITTKIQYYNIVLMVCNGEAMSTDNITQSLFFMDCTQNCVIQFECLERNLQ
jgi:hypothetical protein